MIEGIYVADNETRLRREFEEKGLFVLSLQSRGGLAGLSLIPKRVGKIGTQEFLVFNQELATLLKAGNQIGRCRGEASIPLMARKPRADKDSGASDYRAWCPVFVQNCSTWNSGVGSERQAAR